MIRPGFSAYSRIIRTGRDSRPVPRSVGAYFVVDMAHVAGWWRRGNLSQPLPHADDRDDNDSQDVRGPRGGMSEWRARHEEIHQEAELAGFPGTQVGR